MKNGRIAVYRVLAAQVFFVLAATLAFDLLYQWESLTVGVVGIERLTMIAVVMIPAAVIAVLIALVLFGCVLLVERVAPRLARVFLGALPWVMGAFFLSGYSRMVARFSASILYRVELARGGIAIAPRERLVAFVVLVLLGAVFALAVRWARKRVVLDDRTRVLGAFLFLFTFLSVLVVLGFVVVFGWQSGTHAFQRSSVILFAGFVVLQWQHVNAIFRMRRLFEYPAVAVLGISVLIVAFAGVLSSRNMEAAVVLQRSERHARPEVKNVIFITFDALAADRMSLYGNPRVTTPNLDALAKSSFVFDRMYAASDATVQSMRTIHTGLRNYTDRVLAHGRAVAGGHTIGYMPQFFAQLGWDAVYALLSGRDWSFFNLLAKYNGDSDLIAYAVHGDRVNQLFARWRLDFPKLPTVWLSSLYNAYVQPRLAQWVPPPSQDEISYGSDCEQPAAYKFNTVRKYLKRRTANSSFVWVHSIAPHEPYCSNASVRGSFRKIDPLSDRETSLRHLERSLAEQRSWDHPSTPEERKEMDKNVLAYTIAIRADYDELIAALGFRDLPISAEKQPLMDEMRLMYEEWLLATDADFGKFLEYLKTSGRFDDSMIIVSADHGQAFEKGDVWNTTRVMYEQTARVPLIIHLPGQAAGKRITALVHHVDIMPTIIETLGYAPPAWMEGESLWRYMSDAREAELAPRKSERTIISRVLPSKFAFFANPMYKHLHTFVALRGDYKLISRYYGDEDLNAVEPPPEAEAYFRAFPHLELFNVVKDPKESKNLVDAEPEIRDALMEAIQKDRENVRWMRLQDAL